MSKHDFVDALGKGNDFTVQDGGSVFILRAHTDVAREWIDQHVGDHQTFGGGVVVEHRYISDIVEGMQADGLTGGSL